MRRSVTSILILLACVFADESSALPRYGAIYGQDCRLCHQDPTGGGLRTLYASQFLIPKELAARTPDLETIQPLAGDRLHFGLDLRTLFVEREDESSTQLQMQSDVYLAVQVEESTSIRVDVGRDGVQQAFGMGYFLPANGWLRVGRFTPNYGWKFADHRLYVRRFLLSTDGVRSPLDWHSAGMELGISPGNTVLTASVDQGGRLGESFTTSGTWRANRGRLGLALGASFLRRQDFTGHRRSAGVHGSLRYGPATWLVQWDEPREAGIRERIVSQVVTVGVARGWHLRGVWGFHDPDRDTESGARHRYSAGVDVLFTPFFGVLAMASYDDPERGVDVADAGGWSADFVFHFLY